jgi:PHP family Zn ribbon phosphoesterase
MRMRKGMKFDCIFEETLDFIDIDYTHLNKTIRYEQRPHGEWIDYQDEEYSYLANCSECGYQMNTHEEHGYFSFCPNCGADMRKGEAE